MVALATERAATPARQPGEWRCKRRACATLLASVYGEILVLPDGTRIGPIQPGMVVVKQCPRCKARNLRYL